MGSGTHPPKVGSSVKEGYNGDEFSVVCAGHRAVFLKITESPFDKAQILEGAPAGLERVNNHPHWRRNNRIGLIY